MRQAHDKKMLREARSGDGTIMSNLKLRQLQYENNTWKRALEFVMDENNNLKNRLSEILKIEFNKNLLEKAETFHSNFIKEDQLLSLLRHDVAELDELFAGQWFDNEKTRNDICRKHNNLRRNIFNAEKQFCNLLLEFNEYFSENI